MDDIFLNKSAHCSSWARQYNEISRNLQRNRDYCTLYFRWNYCTIYCLYIRKNIVIREQINNRNVETIFDEQNDFSSSYNNYIYDTFGRFHDNKFNFLEENSNLTKICILLYLFECAAYVLWAVEKKSEENKRSLY